MTNIKKLLINPYFIGAVWVLLAVVAGLLKFSDDAHRNLDVFTGVFQNAANGVCLYEFDPDVALLHNHYGIAFSLVIAPFACLPDGLALMLWLAVSAGVLFLAVNALPIDNWKRVFILWFSLNELFTSLANIQYNILVVAFIVLAFVLVERRHVFWATLFIALGAFTKIYGIGALVFFLFCKDKKRFALSFGFWCVMLFVLPGVFFGFDYMLGSYVDWMTDLSLKSGQNMFSMMQNVSVVGVVRKLTQCVAYSDLWVVVPGLILYLMPLLRVSQYKSLDFRLSVLASTLMFVVLFSNGSESSTYIIAFVGVALWYVSSPMRLSVKWINISLVILVFVFSSLSPTDLFPRSIYRAYFLPYALKAIPVAIVWLKLVGEMMLCNYNKVR